MTHEDDIEIRSLSEFVGEVAPCASGQSRSGAEHSWFRGQRDYRWALLPGAMRPNVVEAATRQFPKLSEHEARGRFEAQLFRSFCEQAGRFRHSIDTPWEAYSTAQHYGMPTRLLDWSTNPLVALHFASKAISRDTAGLEVDGVVYLTDPQYFLHVSEPDGLLTPESPPVPELLAYFTSFGAWLTPEEIQRGEHDLARFVQSAFQVAPAAASATALPLIPEAFDERMQVQRCRFTLHVPTLAHDPQAFEFVGKRYRIVAESKASIRAELSMMGFDELELLPTLDEVAAVIRSEWNV